jgi:nitronate monooxygenase
MDRLSTRLTDELDVDHPVVQAPIGSASTPELAAAVSNAGGLGTLAVTWQRIEDTRASIRETRRLTDGPFAVNLVLDDAATVNSTTDHLAACLDAGVDLVSFSFGDATPYVETVHDAGARVLWTVGSERDAERALDAGADLLVAQGWEAGGHVQSEVATMPLVPAVADAAAERDVPVVAAGGIGDGRGLAAALALGADGAWLGTRFVAAEEAAAHDRYQRRVVDSAATETVFSEVFDKEWPGTPHRTIENSTVREWRAAGRPESGERPGEDDVVAGTADGFDVERYSDLPPTPDVTGDVEAMAMYAGQSTTLPEAVRPAADIVDDIVTEACQRIESIRDCVG